MQTLSQKLITKHQLMNSKNTNDTTAWLLFPVEQVEYGCLGWTESRWRWEKDQNMELDRQGSNPNTPETTLSVTQQKYRGTGSWATVGVCVISCFWTASQIQSRQLWAGKEVHKSCPFNLISNFKDIFLIRHTCYSTQFGPAKCCVCHVFAYSLKNTTYLLKSSCAKRNWYFWHAGLAFTWLWHGYSSSKPSHPAQHTCGSDLHLSFTRWSEGWGV